MLMALSSAAANSYRYDDGGSAGDSQQTNRYGNTPWTCMHVFWPTAVYTTSTDWRRRRRDWHIQQGLLNFWQAITRAYICHHTSNASCEMFVLKKCHVPELTEAICHAKLNQLRVAAWVVMPFMVLYSYLNSNQILYEYQFGFRRYYSTSLALVNVVDHKY